MKLAILGATGFVGRHVVQAAAAAGHSVRALVRDTARVPESWRDLGVTIVEGFAQDVRAVETVLQGSDTLVGLTGTLRPSSWDVALSSHVHALAVCIQAATAAQMPTVWVGSALEYAGEGTLPDSPCTLPTPPLCNVHDPLATGRYGASKAAGSLVALAIAAEQSSPLWYLRMASMYGPNDDGERFIPTALRTLRTGQPLPMTAGAQLREWLHVRDAAQAIMCAVGTPGPLGGAAVNIGTGVGITLRHVAERLCARAGVPTDRLQAGALPYRRGEPHMLVMDVGAQTARLGFAPRIDWDTGLAEL